MNGFLEGSVLFRWLTAAAGWIDRQWEKSFLALLLTGQRQEPVSKSVLGRFFDRLHGALCALFRVTRLDRALEGSISTRLLLWCGLTVLVAPLLPTMAVLGLVMLCALSLMICLGRDRERRLVWSPVNKWIYLFAAVYLVCTLTSVTPRGSLKGGMLTVAFVLFAIVLQNAVTDRRQLDVLIALLVLGGFLVSLYGFAQVILGVESTAAWVDDSFVENGVSLRVYSTLDNPNVLSEYLLLIIPLGAVAALTARTRQGKAAGAVATAAMILCLVLTLSRGGYLGLVLAAALFLVLLDRRFIVLGVIGCICLLFFLPETILLRIASIADMSDTSTSYRLNIWIATIDMLKDYWMSGIGPGITAFNTVYPLYSLNTIAAPHAHNLYLQILVECGISGFVAFMGGVLSWVRALAGKVRRSLDKKTRLQAIAFLCSITGFLAQSVTDYSFYNYRVELMFWVVLALGAALARNWDRGEAGPC